MKSTTINYTQTESHSNAINAKELQEVEPYRFVDSEMDLDDSITFKLCLDKSITDLYNALFELGFIKDDGDNYLEHINTMPATSNREVLERLAGMHAKLIDHNLE
jgi:hypothetical protein